MSASPTRPYWNRITNFPDKDNGDGSVTKSASIAYGDREAEAALMAEGFSFQYGWTAIDGSHWWNFWRRDWTEQGR